MTTEIDLLPLPEGEASSFGNYKVHDNEAMIEYARANVARNTALLRAEIEALRAEVDVLKAENALLREALLAIVDEVSDGLTPYSLDSYLPVHLVEQARAALAKENSND